MFFLLVLFSVLLFVHVIFLSFTTMADVLRFLSYNVRGLCDRVKCDKLFSKFIYSSHVASHPHIVFFQETNLKKSHSYEINLALNQFDVYQVYENAETCSGGLLTAIHKGLNCEILHDIRGKFFILTHCKIGDEEYVLVNVYFRLCRQFTQLLTELQHLWKCVLKYPAAKVVLGGDFNQVMDCMMDTLAGKTNREPSAQVFADFVEQVGLSDVWRAFHPDERRYTWHRRSPCYSSHLDYFLLSDLAFNYCWDAQIGSSYLSDHAPITLELLLNRNDRGKGLFRFTDFLCTDKKFRELLQADIATFKEVNITQVNPSDRASPALLLDTLKAIIRGRTIKFLATTRKKSGEKLKALDEQIRELTTLHDGFTEINEEYDIVLQKLDRAVHSFDEAFTTHSSKTRSKNFARVSLHGNASSAFFFRRVRGIPGAIRYLFDDTGQVLQDDQQILEHCRIFYDNLHFSWNNSFRISNFTRVVPENRLNQEEIAALAEEITFEEVTDALLHMKEKASPGFDGLTVSFYRSFWDLVGRFVFDSIKFAEDRKTFTKDQRRGVIKMLPKRNKAPNRIGNLRPITLLNVDYKLVTKVLASRVKAILPRIIHTDQQGFVSNHFLGNHVLDIQTLMHLLETSEIQADTAILSLDIHKAFDSVDWTFLTMVLRSYGFPTYFLDWIDAMHQDVELRVLNNGHLSDPVFAKKGVAQGCSLSPYLFVLVIETLACYIRSCPWIKGLFL